MRKWQMQEAKAKFADVVRQAAAEGPQIVTYRGADTAVVLSIDEYRRTRGKAAFLCRSPVERTQIGRRDGRSHQPTLHRHGTGYRSVSFLLDTNVVSETRRKAPAPKVVAWVSQADPSDLFISAMTLGEIAKGVALGAKQSPAQAAGLEQWLAETRTEYAIGSSQSMPTLPRLGGD